MPQAVAKPCTMSSSATDLMNVDILHSFMEHVDSVATLRTLKCVSKEVSRATALPPAAALRDRV